jgi:hypothetical protein
LARARIAWDHEHVHQRLIALAVLTAAATAAADDAAETGKVRLSGIVVSANTGEVLAGVTIVAAGWPGVGEEVAISDEHGAYVVDVVPGVYTVTMYYNENTLAVVRDLTVQSDLSIGLTRFDDTPGPTECCCFFDIHESPDLTSYPRHGITSSRDHHFPSRDRTHRAWIVPAAAADPERTVTQINGSPRFTLAPGIPLAFVDTVATHTLRVPITHAAGSAGSTDVTLRQGSNEMRGDARAVLALDRRDASGGGELFASGPLVHDKAWFATGLVASRRADGTDDAAALVGANYAATSEHQLAVAGIAQPRDQWAGASWTSKFHDNKLQLDLRASGERLELAAVTAARLASPLARIVDRAGAGIGLSLRGRRAGYHRVAVAADGGAGSLGDVRHTDVSLAAGDEWQLRPNIEVHAGVRTDTRTFGRERVTVTSPRVALTYDITKEGRSDLFVAYQRVPLVDDGLPGDWLAQPTLHRDELAVGASWERSAEHWPMFGVAGRARRTGETDEYGLEAWLRHDTRRMTLHTSATTLGRIVTIAGQRRLVDKRRDDLIVGTLVRVAPERGEGGGTLVWRHDGARRDRGDSDASIELAVEGYGGTAGPGGRLLLGVGW